MNKFAKLMAKKMTGVYVSKPRTKEACPKCFREVWVSEGQILKQCKACKNENKQ